MLYQCYISVVSVLYQCCISVVSVLYQCCISVVSVLYQCYTLHPPPSLQHLHLYPLSPQLWDIIYFNRKLSQTNVGNKNIISVFLYFLYFLCATIAPLGLLDSCIGGPPYTPPHCHRPPYPLHRVKKQKQQKYSNFFYRGPPSIPPTAAAPPTPCTDFFFFYRGPPLYPPPAIATPTHCTEFFFCGHLGFY